MDTGLGPSKAGFPLLRSRPVIRSIRYFARRNYLVGHSLIDWANRRGKMRSMTKTPPRQFDLQPPASVPPLERFSIRAAVLLGFLLMLGIWLFAWYPLNMRIAEAQAQAAAINERYARAQEVLSSVRTQVVYESVYLRDALLDPDPQALAGYRAQLEASSRAVDETLKRYVPFSNSEAEREQFTRVRQEVDAFRSTMLDVFSTGGSRTPDDARRLLTSRITPSRDSVIGVSEQVQGLNRSGYVRQQGEIADIYREVQQQVWVRLGAALIIGLAIAALAVFYAGRLEGRIRQHMVRNLQITRDLQRLSAKLVTAQEEERRNIARELHDEIGQALTAVKVELALAQRSVENAGGPPRGLENARSITDVALQQVRDLSHLLHPAMLDDLGLIPTVESYVKRFGQRHAIRSELLHEGVHERLAAEIEASVYRIIQEAMTNVAKHSKATLCRVQLKQLVNTLWVQVEDDGVGFDADSVIAGDRRGLGLISIRERVSQLGGRVWIHTAPGQGTRLTVEMPVRPRRLTDELGFVHSHPVSATA